MSGRRRPACSVRPSSGGRGRRRPPWPAAGACTGPAVRRVGRHRTGRFRRAALRGRRTGPSMTKRRVTGPSVTRRFECDRPTERGWRDRTFAPPGGDGVAPGGTRRPEAGAAGPMPAERCENGVQEGTFAPPGGVGGSSSAGDSVRGPCGKRSGWDRGVRATRTPASSPSGQETGLGTHYHRTGSHARHGPRPALTAYHPSSGHAARASTRA